MIAHYGADEAGALEATATIPDDRRYLLSNPVLTAHGASKAAIRNVAPGREDGDELGDLLGRGRLLHRLSSWNAHRGAGRPGI